MVHHHIMRKVDLCQDGEYEESSLKMTMKGEKDDDAKAADMIEDQCNVLQNLFELQFLLLYFGFKSRETIQLLPALKIDHNTKRKNLNLVHI